ncbi:alginate lyase family protein [Hallella faecis]|uniref:Alginate lyase family protein n=1 Tax=Hallella faecis TaxID=2841596 RepID=A0ABV1FM73_9BACT|nr:alginate lyase family protein [Hallella faecis]MBU0289199.1 alginate lyase family protein [Hallella faecis]
MKKIYALLATLLLTIGVTAQSYNTNRGFVHPGGLHTQEDFDRIKDLLAKGDPTITAAVKVLTQAAYAQSTAGTSPVQTIVRGGGKGENYINAARGATIAYQNALVWKITGNKANASHAINVLMQWANTTKGIGGDSNYALAAGLYGYQFAQAAELLRDYEGWAPERFEQFRQWMLQVWYPSAMGFLRGRNGTWENVGKWWQAPGHYWSNWGLCNALCVMSIGVLCDDVFIYNQGLSYMKYDQVGTFTDPRTANPILNDGLTEFMGNLVVTVTNTPANLKASSYGTIGQMQESGRDIGHATMAAGLAIDIAHMAWNQGDDLFSFMDNRLAAGIEFVAAQTQNIEGLPWTNYKYGSGGIYYTDSRAWTMTGPALGNQIRPYWGTVIGHYQGVLGKDMPYSEMAYANLIKNGPDGGGQGSTSGGYDHLGYSVLMNYRDHKATAEEVPTLLAPKMVVGNDTLSHNELGGLVNTFKTNNNTGVAKGTVIKLLPQLRDGSEDSGQWQWNTGETTRNLTVTANESYVYRVCYTNKHGVKSYLCFSIAVQGDCEPTPVEVSATYNGVTATDSITIFYDDAITLKAASKDGFGSFAWSTGATNSNITVKNLRNDTLFTVAFKNQGGAISYDTIRVHLKYFRPQMAVNGKVKVDTVQCLCQPGDKVAFAPYVPSTFKDIRFQWSSGSTERSVTYNDIQTTIVDTLVYTLFGKSDTVCYVAYLSDTLDSAIPEGYYLIRDRFHDTYLTNNTVEGLPYANATFTAKKEGDALQQQAWKVTNENVDGPCYDLQNLADQRYLALTMRMTASTRTPYYFRKATGTQWYHLRNKRPCYFTINDDGTVDHTTYYVPTNFPVELIPYTLPAGIHDIHADKVSDDKRYNIQGQRVGADYKGLIIHNGKKYIIR